MGIRTSGLLLGGCIALTGCFGAHVELPRAPSRDAPMGLRVQAYNAFRPLATQYTTTISYGRYGSSMSTAATGVLLANGTRVTFPEDLIPLAGATSALARAAHETSRVQQIGTILTWSGFGTSLLGVGLIFGGFAELANSFGFGGSGGGDAVVPLLLTGTGLLLGGLIPLFIGAGFGGAAARNRETAYQLYEPSLRENLGLCGDGAQVGDCVQTFVPASPPPPSTNAVPPVQITP